MSYYDVDQILTEAEKVPCTFKIDSTELGYLDNTPTTPLKPGSKLSLPLWLAQMLATAATANGQPALEMNMPSSLSTEVLQALKADPRAVPLAEQSHHFYSLANTMLDLFDDPQVAELVRLAWTVRSAEIAGLARQARGETTGAGSGVGIEGEEFLRGLDNWERAFFKKAHEARRDVKEFTEKGAKC